MNAEPRSKWLQIRDRLRGVSRWAGSADVIFLTASVLAITFFSYLNLAGTPPSPELGITVRGAYLALAIWYVVVGLRRQRLLGYFREAIEKTPSAFALYDDKDRLIAHNSVYEAVHTTAFANISGPITYEKLVRTSLPDSLSGEELKEELARRLRNHRQATGEATDRLYPNGRWFRVQKARTESGANVGVAIDVTELYEAKAAADREQARFRSLAENLPIGIWHFDAEGRTIFANQGLLSLFGLENANDIEGVAAPEFIAAHVDGYDAASLNAGDSDLRTFAIHRADGQTRQAMIRASELPGDIGNVDEELVSFVDVTALKEAERRIDYLAHSDVLTGAGNRAAFVAAIEAACKVATQADPCWVMAIDLDEFKPINDQYGHAAGDKVLREFASRIKRIGPRASSLYRLGGDEFCVLLSGHSRSQVEDLARAYVASAERPYRLGHVQIAMTASIGIAAMPIDAKDAETVQRHADLALYSTKKHSGGGYAFFTRVHAERDLEERVLMLDISRALASNEFEFAYQPVYARSGQAIVGIEALLRWTNQRTGKDVPTAEFIAAAERSGAISRIDYWVLGAVAAQMSYWNELGIDIPLMMINMSPVTLEDSDFIKRLDTVLDKRPEIRGHLCIEITEGVVWRDLAQMCDTFEQLRARGIKTAIDDFGAGQTSVALLRDLPVSFIKIDRSYISGIELDSQALAIVSTIVRLGTELGVQVIAEGVETRPQLAALEAAGCELIQGYLLGAPVGTREIERRLGAAHAAAPGGDLTRQG